MKIVFSGIGCGFANNGGSKTIMSCANVLSGLGHEVIIATSVFNFSWFKVKAKVVKEFPKNADVIIATAVSTVKPVALLDTKARKFWYIRGWETWNKSCSMEKEVRRIPVIVNSEWLRDKVHKCIGKYPPIVYPGIDEYFYSSGKFFSDEVTVGGLYCSRGLKRFKLWIKVVKRVMEERRIRVRLFGDEDKPVLPFDFDYVRRPESVAHRGFYNSCDIWLFTSENEGLHIPPMEAGACGCALVGSDIGGVRDYAVHGETALLGEDYVGNVIRLVDDVDLRSKLSSNLIKLLNEKIGGRCENMKRLVKLINS
jgi:glycosyltransferase involved in cell wall biosynthesis